MYEILQMHPALEICDEPFNENRADWAPGNKNYAELVRDWDSLETVLDEIFRSSNGFKLLSYQLREDWVHRLIVDRPDFRVVFIRRRNLLQAVVSVLIAEQTRLWHRWDTDRPVETYYGELEPLDVLEVRTRVHDLAREVQGLEAAVAQRTDGHTHSLIYEELFFAQPAEQDRGIRTLWSFLGLDPIASDRIDYFLRPHRSKLNSSSTYRRLPNVDDVERECGSDITGHLF